MPTHISENFLFKYLELYHMNAEKVDLSQKKVPNIPAFNCLKRSKGNLF